MSEATMDQPPKGEFNTETLKGIVQKYGFNPRFLEVGTVGNWNQVLNSVNRKVIPFLDRIGVDPFIDPFILGEVINLLLRANIDNIDNLRNSLTIDQEKFQQAGGDPAKILRATIYALSFPQGIDSNNENFSFSIDSGTINRLLKMFPNLFPSSYRSLNAEQLKQVLADLGFKENPNLGREGGVGGYSLNLDQQGVKTMLRGILATHSSNPTSRSSVTS
jgi:hypothetical protein